MNTLIINAGSSSVKFRFYEQDAKGNDVIVYDGVVDRIGTSSGATLEITQGEKNAPEKNVQKVPVVHHRDAGKLILTILRGHSVEQVIHRVVHGGRHEKPEHITPGLIKELKDLVVLAPLHLPHAIELIELFDESHIPGVVCFDTMFHMTMPEQAKTYPIPQDLAQKYGIIRYGFHGLAHEQMAKEASMLAKKKYKDLRIITCQMGNGVSLCAIKDGKSVDTSMGFTPLEGLMMGTRSGDIDPAIMPFLMEHENLNRDSCLDILETRSGFKAIGGYSDVRDLLANEIAGDPKAILALDMFAYRIRLKIGAYVAALGGVDMIVLGGGIARSKVMRQRILENMECFGILLDAVANEKGGLPLKLHKGKTMIYVIDVDEQEHMLDLVRAMK